MLWIELLLCYQLSIQEAIIESDSLMAQPQMLASLEKNILAFGRDPSAQRFFPFHIVHVYREVNTFSDRLASYGALGNTIIFYHIELPKHIIGIYIWDTTGIPCF